MRKAARRWFIPHDITTRLISDQSYRLAPTKQKFYLHLVAETVVLFLCGGAIYASIEILWRGYTHWTMAALGGLLFLLIGGLNNWFPWEMSLVLQGTIGAALVTGAELIAGIILNRWLALNIWDYSHLPGNFMGQICPQFSFAWLFLSIVAVVLDDWLRYWIFGGIRPHYTLFGRST